MVHTILRRRLPDLTQRPIPFAVYYGFPGQVAGCSDANCATKALRAFPLTVLGDGLEQERHPEHALTRRIIYGLRDTECRLYGYVDLGMTTGALEVTEIAQRLVAWSDLGATGILLDDAGAEYGVSPERLNACVTLAHGHGLSVIVNAGDPVDAFVANSPLRSGDAYLYEAFAVSDGACLSVSDLLTKCEVARSLAPDGVRLFALATCENDPTLFAYIWTTAILAGMDGVGIAPPGYGAVRSSTGYLGAVCPLLGSFGTRFVTERPHLQGDRVIRETDTGQIWMRMQPEAQAVNAGFIRTGDV